MAPAKENGDLVVYRYDCCGGAKVRLWSSSTAGHWGAKLRIQGDGNLVIWNQSNNDCIWHSNTHNRGIIRWANAHQGGFYGYTSNGTAIGIDNPQYC